MSLYEIGATVFGNWRITKELGQGSYGAVYELQREDFGVTAYSALKVISIPGSEAELRTMMEDGSTPEEVELRLESQVRHLVEEFSIMARLKATEHIVSIEDHAVIRKVPGPGWDILIRMELLTPFPQYRKSHPLSKEEIIWLGIDICKALELCREQRILHRDIKPANIMVTDRGTFKLADFGIARTLEETTSELSKTGTPNYMAPEVYLNRPYDFSVDIYSLGIVMYWLLNQCCLPFSPTPPIPKTHANQAEALNRRIGGEAIPMPLEDQGDLAWVILKACAYQPQDRFANPTQFRMALEYILPGYQNAPAEIADNDTIWESDPRSSFVRPEDRTQLQEEAEPSSFHSRSLSQSQRPPVTQENPFAPSRKAPSDSWDASNWDPPAKEKKKAEKKTPAKKKPAKEAPGKEKASEPDLPKKKGSPLPVILLILLAALGLAVTFLLWEQGTRKQEQYRDCMTQAMACRDSDPEQALTLYRQAGALYPEEESPGISFAYTLCQLGRWEECIRYIEQELTLENFSLQGQAQLGEILGTAYFELEDYEQASDAYRQAEQAAGLTPAAWLDYAVSLGRLGDRDGAEEVLADMQASGGSEASAAYVQAELALARQQYPAAEEGFLALLNSTRDKTLQSRAVRSLTRLYQECAVLDQSGLSPIPQPAYRGAMILEQCLSLYHLETDPVLTEALGLAWYEACIADPDRPEDYLEKAAAAFRQVLELGVREERLYRNLCSIYEALGDPDRALAVLEDYALAFPQDYTPYALKAILLIKLENEKDQRLQDYTAAREAADMASSLLLSMDDRSLYEKMTAMLDEVPLG